ncbi:MAG: helix-turn-helix transcriptional regulator [Bacteroidales bacterium]|nr:helix-turn-helix transcriptional regulator [Bacteroidales bacterium]
MDKFHENIQKVRIKLNLSQEVIADKMGIDRTTFNRFETGKTALFSKNMRKFAKVVELSEEEILLGDNPSGYLREGSLEDRMQELSDKIDFLTVQLDRISSAIQKLTGKTGSKKDGD